MEFVLLSSDGHPPSMVGADLDHHHGPAGAACTPPPRVTAPGAHHMGVLWLRSHKALSPLPPSRACLSLLVALLGEVLSMHHPTGVPGLCLWSMLCVVFAWLARASACCCGWRRAEGRIRRQVGGLQ